MKEVIYLERNKFYFYAGFLDEKLTTPVIDTYIYIGFDKEHGHIFEDVDNRGTNIYFANNEVNSIYDCAALSKWLVEEVNSQNSTICREYEYKNL